ncbi:DNA polymerase III subunit delta' [Sulfurimonas sp.]|uniref:DNA polymerase III subunit delta' n=1 Tax=Sulfurimonas sp. TaxID=2022749 RepID=UPI0025F390AE|nr:DNA polymerase III subunit delta' [Sulfurimonas sp.]
MLVSEAKRGYILVSTEIEKEVNKLVAELKPSRVVSFIEEDFKLEHAKAVVAESYISESETKYIIIAASTFGREAQNSLLKILEEPPRNIEFIIISPTKSNLLPTVRSRLPIVNGEKLHTIKEVELNLAKIDYAQVFKFLKANARVTKTEAKELIEGLYYRATVVDMLMLSTKQLDSFDRAYRLLELNSRAQSVFAELIMGFAGDKNAAS